MRQLMSLMNEQLRVIGHSFAVIVLASCTSDLKVDESTNESQQSQVQNVPKVRRAQPVKAPEYVSCLLEMSAQFDDTSLVIRFVMQNRGSDTLAFMPTFMKVSMFPQKGREPWRDVSGLCSTVIVDTLRHDSIPSIGWREPLLRFAHTKGVNVQFVVIPPKERISLAYHYTVDENVSLSYEDVFHLNSRLNISVDGVRPFWSSRSKDAWTIISDCTVRREQESRSSLVFVKRGKWWEHNASTSRQKTLDSFEYYTLEFTRAKNKLDKEVISIVATRR